MLVVLITLLIGVRETAALQISELNESECLEAEGEWIVPLGIDVREDDRRQPNCQCNQGFYFNITQCTPKPKQILCESSDGIWSNNECVCPENSVGWTDSVGCDYIFEVHTTQKLNSEFEAKGIIPAKNSLVVFSMFVVIIGLIAVGFYLKRRKKW